MQRSLISLGWRCDTAFELRMHGAENVAHFFDWLVTPIEGLFRILENDFDVFHPEDLVLKTDTPNDYVEDSSTGVVFFHQFPLYADNMQPDFLLHYPGFIQKFKYLAERFRTYMNERKVTLVRQNISAEEALRLEDLILRLYPNADVRFLYLNENGEIFETPLGQSYIIKQDGSLGIPSEWIKVLNSEELIEQPYRHSTLDIFGSLHHDYNLSIDHRFNEEQLQEAIAANPKKIEFRLELARWYALRWLWQKAESEILLAVIEAPDNVMVKCIAIQINLRCGHITASQAAQELLQIIDQAQPQDEWLSELANYFLEAGDAQSALVYIRKALELAPTTWSLYLTLADCLWALTRHQELQNPLELYKKFQDLPHSYEHYLAHACEANGNLEAALEAEDRFLSHELRFDALYFKSYILKDLGRYEEALDVCEQAKPMMEGYEKFLEGRILELKNLQNSSLRQA